MSGTASDRVLDQERAASDGLTVHPELGEPKASSAGSRSELGA